MKELVRRQLRGFPIYAVPTWEGAPIRHGFGTRGCSLHNYLGVGAWWIPTTRQIHSGVVHALDGLRSDVCLHGDAFITNTPEVVCGIRTADCLPILAYDPDHHAVAAIHAGWRGLVAGIIPHTIAAMGARYRTRPSQLRVAIGPAIGPLDYEIDEPVVTAMRRAGLHVDDVIAPTSDQHWRLHLPQLAQQVLLEAGMDPTNITTNVLSTFTREGEFNSYRRQTTHAGRQYSFISILRPVGKI